MRILIICETIDFKNFTRRATIEAIGLMNKDTVALCHTSFKNIFKVNLSSKYIKVFCLYYLLNTKLREVKILRLFELQVLRHFWNAFFESFDYVMITSPNQAYLLDLLHNKKLIFLVSDPYHLMGYNTENIKKILSLANIVLTTSKELKKNYLKKYFNYTKNEDVHYWPNTVDLELWGFENNKKYIRNKDNIVIGFSGNFMQLTDIDLLEYIVVKYPTYKFQIAGRITYNEKTYANKLNEIFKKQNVHYLGWINYEDLPKTVINWDVCLMIDDKSELSSYHHHNKLYQYLALGKPVVLQRNHNDYDEFSDILLIADTYDEYIHKIQKALEIINNDNHFKESLSIAENNSSAIRAKQFLKMLDTLQ